jgi:hypothetical protein
MPLSVAERESVWRQVESVDVWQPAHLSNNRQGFIEVSQYGAFARRR